MPQASIIEGSKASNDEQSSKDDIAQAKKNEASAVISAPQNEPMTQHGQTKLQHKAMWQRKNAKMLSSIINTGKNASGKDQKYIVMNRLNCDAEQVLLIQSDGEKSMQSNERKPCD